MKSLAETLAVDAQRSAADQASIAQSWDTLTAALDAGGMSEHQYARMLDAEPPIDADPLVWNLWARALRRAARDPKGIGTDLDSFQTFTCRCGPGRGWLFEMAPSPGGLTTLHAKPCPDCNYRQRELWVDCWSQGGDHVCAKCRPRGGKTPTPLAGDAGVGADARAAESQARLDAETDAMFDGLK